MDYIKAFLIKYVMTTVVLWLVLGFFAGAGIGAILLLGLLITLVGFFLGDLVMLPRFENWGATITDFLLVYAVVWTYSTYMTTIAISAILAATATALIVSACEVFFHMYVDSHILHVEYRTGGREKDDLSLEERLQTEVGEEIDPIEEEDERKK